MCYIWAQRTPKMTSTKKSNTLSANTVTQEVVRYQREASGLYYTENAKPSCKIRYSFYVWQSLRKEGERSSIRTILYMAEFWVWGGGGVAVASALTPFNLLIFGRVLVLWHNMSVKNVQKYPSKSGPFQLPADCYFLWMWDKISFTFPTLWVLSWVLVSPNAKLNHQNLYRFLAMWKTFTL